MRKQNYSRTRIERLRAGVATERGDGASYQVVFEGKLRDGCDPAAVRGGVARAMKLSERRTERLFSGRRIVIARDLDRDRAFRVVARLAALGAVTHAEPSPPDAAKSAKRRGWRLPWVVAAVALVAVGAAGGIALGVYSARLSEPVPSAAEDASPATPGGQPRSPPPAATSSNDPPSVSQRDLPPALRTLPAAAQEEYLQRYLPSPDHKAFAIAESGAFGWHQGAASENNAREVALDQCLKARRRGDGECRIVDADGAWED